MALPLTTCVQLPRIVNHVKTLDLSAFLVVAWCTYRSLNTLKLSVVIRTIVAEATIYFLAMVAVQVYVQLSYILAEVSLFLLVHIQLCDH